MSNRLLPNPLNLLSPHTADLTRRPVPARIIRAVDHAIAVEHGQWMWINPMTDLTTLALAILAGFQSGCITSWRYYKRQRDDQDAVRRQYEARIGLLEHDLDRERLERHRAEESLRPIRNPRRQTPHGS